MGEGSVARDNETLLPRSPSVGGLGRGESSFRGIFDARSMVSGEHLEVSV